MKKRILVASLNWGLGHATRCIPIINVLIEQGFEPIIASDGVALALLKKEFPNILCLELPSYNITYPKKGKYFKLKLIKNVPKLLRTIKAEEKATKNIVNKFGIKGIISDNRLGVYNKQVSSVFITHQLRVLSGNTTWLSTKIHQKMIKKFDVCWIPDASSDLNLSGKLGHVKSFEIPLEYIGPLSRFETKSSKKVYDLMLLLSGPEPQRTLLEEKLLQELKHYHGKVIFIRGVVETKQKKQFTNNMTIYNFLNTHILEKTINESELIISRSGYTTIMDLAKLNKKAFFIPTPGQYEQEYLAKRLMDLGLAPSCNQDEFSLKKLEKIADFKGLHTLDFEVDYKKLFNLFERK